MITPSFGLTATERVLPKLALDFTTASLDSRVTFTRTTDATHPATYVNSNGYVTSSTNNQPRFDYSPVTLACKGLLIEESRANLLPYSSDYSQTDWVKNRCSVSTGATTSPDGTLNACKVIEDSTASSTHFINSTVTFTSGTAQVVTFFAKAGERTLVSFGGGGFGGQGFSAIFNLANCTMYQNNGNKASIENYGNGWCRCVIPFTPSASTTCNISLCDSTGNTTYSGNGTSGAYIWGVQMETGAFATSYIPTTTTALTRNADVATMTGTNFSSWYNQSAGTFTANITSAPVNNVAQVAWYTSDGTTTNAMFTRRNTSGFIATGVLTSNVSQGDIISGASIAANASYKTSFSYAVNNLAISTNSANVGTDTSATIPSIDRIALGANVNAAQFLNGYLRKFAYYPLKLTNAELQSTSA